MKSGSVVVLAAVLIAMVAAVAVTAISLSPSSTTASPSSSSQFTSIVSSSSSVPSSSIIPLTGQIDSWNRTTSYPLPIARMSCVTAGGFAYCVGGGDEAAPRGSGGLNNTYYAPLSNSGIGQWTESTEYPLPIMSPSCVESSGFIYCVGGIEGATSDTTLTSDVFYAPLSPSGIGRWARTTPYPNPTSLPSCVVDSSYIYCVSQNASIPFTYPTGDTYFATLSATGVGKWTESSEIPSNPLGCVATGGSAYCFGGYCNNADVCTDFAYYAQLSSNGISPWSQTTALPNTAQDAYTAGNSYLYFFATPDPLVAHLSSSGIGPWNSTAAYPEESPAGCFTSGAYLYCIGSDRIDFTPSQSVYFGKIG